ncbi:MAG: homing endonuclease associated repeat-containing protein [Caulobacteraceae bacterium]
MIYKYSNTNNKDYYKTLLQDLAQELKHTPSVNESLKARLPVYSIRKAFGSYNKALAAAGLKIRREWARGSSDKETMLRQYKEYSEALGRPATYRELNAASGIPSGSTYCMKFVGMRGLKIAAGYPPDPIDRRKYTREEIAEKLKVEVKKEGRLLTTKEVNENPNLPSLPTVLKYYETTHLQDVWTAMELADTTTLKMAL